MIGDRQAMRRQLYQLVAGQAGYFTAAQAVDIGYSYQAQKHHVDYGNWARVDRGVFRIPEWPTGRNDVLVRWWLWSKQRAVVSHNTAASVHDLGLFNPSKVHLTVPPRFRMSDDHLVLYHRHLPSGDITNRDGAPVTTMMRTVLDLIESEFDDELLGSAIDDAVRQGRVSRRKLERRMSELSDADSVRGFAILDRMSS